MVIGLNKFKEFFSAYTSSYVLIGGSACEVNLAQGDIPFRATKDLDIVLHVEALDAGFVSHFWEFIREGGYAIAQKATGERQFYRFQRPAHNDYPAMIELFSHHPEFPLHAPDSTITPIPAEEDCSSLSAILLDDDYYHFLYEHTTLIDNLAVASPLALIVFKAKAWMDLSARKADGVAIDSADIKKHRNDIARLLPTVPLQPVILPAKIKAEMMAFIEKYEAEKIDTRALRIPLPEDEVKHILRLLFDDL